MSRYKVLPAQPWLTRAAPGSPHWRVTEHALTGYKEIEPVFKRVGWYFDRQTNRAWYEAHGRAWLCRRPDDFLYCLKLADHRQLSGPERVAIQALLHRNNCPKELREQLVTDNEIRMLREIRRNGYMVLRTVRRAR